MIAMLAASVVASCTKEPKLSALSTASAPPASKITRLLIWLPSDDSAADAKEMALQFTSKLSALGVAVQIGRSTALELDRGDDQKPFVAAFKPTHRLEIDTIATVRYSGGMVSAIVHGQTPTTYLKVALYDATGKTSLRSFSYGPAHKFGGEFAETILAKLKEDGFL